MNIVFASIISYLLGSIPTALIVVWVCTKKDVRAGKSGNMGALNTLRTVKEHRGIVWGLVAFVVVFSIDMLKAVVALLITQYIIANAVTAITIATVFSIIGHNYPIWLKGKGGRGAASFMGILIYFNPLMFVAWLGIILIFAILAELVALYVLNKKESLKKVIVHAASDQIAGRLLGELVGVYIIYAFNHQLLIPAILATLLIVFRHTDRLKKQLQGYGLRYQL